jgi:hypothetical protein
MNILVCFQFFFKRVSENITEHMLMVGNEDAGHHLTMIMVVLILVVVGFRNGPVVSSMEWVVVVTRPMGYRYLLHRCQCRG